MTTDKLTEGVEAEFVIAHATRLVAEDVSVFEHSVALARSTGAPLYTLHAVDGEHDIAEMPSAQALLERWGGGEVSHHTLRHSEADGDTVDALLDALRMIAPSLLVVGKRRGSGLRELIRESVSESLARNINSPTLVLPIGAAGLVDSRTGALRLGRVLVPTESEEAMLPALAAIDGLLEQLGADGYELTLLHVGEGDEDELALMLPEGPLRRRVTVISRRGDLVDQILEVSEELDVDLIAMATRGHDSLMDMARGSHTERIMRRAERPVLTAPMRPPKGTR